MTRNHIYPATNPAESKQEYKWAIIKEGGIPQSVSVFVLATAEPLIATRLTKQFDAIVAGVQTNAPLESLRGFFDIAKGINSQFTRITERVTLLDGDIYFDGDKQVGALAELAMSALFSGDDKYFRTLVNFMEKCQQNPNPRSRDQAFNWLKRHKFLIAPDGDIIAYKGVRENGSMEDDEYISGSLGSAIVNGVWFKNQQIPTSPGAIVEMPRSTVNADPRQGCSTGLHAANQRFAWGYGTLLRVKINPRDIVSVPEDSAFEKMRVCRYHVLGLVNKNTDTEVMDFYTETEVGTRFIDQKPADAKPTAKKTVKKAAPVKKAPVKKVAPAAKATVKKAAVKKAAPAAKAPVKKAAVKKAAPKAVAKPTELPKFYEHWTEDQFKTRPLADLKWLGTQWGFPTGGWTVAKAAKNLAVKAADLAKILSPKSKKFTPVNSK